jgi:PAS domain S-box-containing protein
MGMQDRRVLNRSRVLWGLALALVYFLAAKWGLTLAFVQANATAVWPPTGIALAALLIGGWRLWPGVFLGAFLANLLTNGTVLTSLGIATGNSLEALVGYGLVNRFAHGRDALRRTADLFKFAVLGGLMAPVVSATVGVGTLALAGLTGQAPFKDVWFTWWLGDMGGALLVAPPILLWPGQFPAKLKPLRWMEGALLSTTLFLTAWLLFGGWSVFSMENYQVQFLLLPLLLWAAVRFGPFPTSLAVLVLFLLAIQGTLHGLGPFYGGTDNQSLLFLQTFMSVTSVTILALACGVAERREAEENLRWSHSDLQLRVLERTEDLQKANLVLAREIRQKEALSDELINSEQHFRALIENALDIVTILDHHGLILFESPSVSRFLGYAQSELYGINAFSLVHSEDVPRVQEAFMDILEKPGNIRIVKFRFKHKDGSWRILESIGSNLLSDPAIKGVVVNSRDVTLEEEIRRALAEREERLRLLVENVRDYAIILLDPEGKVVTWNVGAQRINGYEASEIVGQPISCFYPPEDVQSGKPRKLLDVAIESGRVEEEGWRVRKDGSRFLANVIITSLKDEKGKLRGFAKITRDITLRKRMEELARSNKELEQFAYVASHDLQEPLRMVTSFVQLLARKYRGKMDAEADQYIHQVVDGTARMRALILDLLAYSRVDSAGATFGKVDCAKALGQALGNLDASLKESQADVASGQLPLIWGNFNQIEQLFQNLIGNAIKFRGASAPQVRVEAREKNGEWVFCVRDNGIGIDPKYSDQIFEIFKRLHTRSEYPGTGIGLAICKKVVARHGGRIWVESEAGKGAAFYWTLPVLKEVPLEYHAVS